MLKFMRRHATGFLIKALFGVIIIVFIFWGVGSFREREKVVAEVGPYKVYYTEYTETYNKFLNIYKILYKDSLDDSVLKSLKIKEKVMDELIDKYVMLINAKKMGIHVYEKELNDYITGINAFKRDGKFSQKVYEEILKRHNLDPKRFEEAERVSIITSRFINIIIDNGVFIKDDELWKAYVDEKGSVDMFYMTFDPKDYTDKVTITEKEIEDLYEKEKASFKNENTYRLKYMSLMKRLT
ncbi:MAG: SurA N-terminal domain-containing protein [Syntrophorhabdaceae bacterium]|nr:SurA N-terminal domain-containing protein [Syntrophorhabdaceae bacterium]